MCDGWRGANHPRCERKLSALHELVVGADEVLNGLLVYELHRIVNRGDDGGEREGGCVRVKRRRGLTVVSVGERVETDTSQKARFTQYQIIVGAREVGNLLHEKLVFVQDVSIEGSCCVGDRGQGGIDSSDVPSVRELLDGAEVVLRTQGPLGPIEV
ncbi:hypothetical protein OE88DRAFT_1529810 [Heliocybe sulcata]|uniref:Uncharacterized protein n=1 Tax=Heliocybe sulcata TaxID=5364 RepID=A0A5C3N587_9AGAM|nr:hypothetical protein OE88DRAFT_1529810 [Heliocybe sulcata]